MDERQHRTEDAGNKTDRSNTENNIAVDTSQVPVLTEGQRTFRHTRRASKNFEYLEQRETEAIEEADNCKPACYDQNPESNEHSELCELIIFYIKIFIPTLFIFLTRFIQQLANVSYLGQTYQNSHIIDAVGLAHLYTNVLLFSFCIVVAYTFDFLGSRAYGAKNYDLFGIYLHRTIFLMLLIFLILYIIHYFTAAKLMLLFGMDIYQYEYFQRYMTLFQLSYVFEFPHVIWVRFLNLVGRPYISVIVMFVSTALHFLFCHVFIKVLDMGVDGAALASICTQFINITGEMFYILVFKPLPQSIFWLRADSFHELWEFMKVYFPLLPIGMSGLWAQEVQMFIAFSIGNLDLAAHVVLQTIANIFLGISFGNSFTTVIIVGYFIGQEDLTKIKKILYVSAVGASSVVFVMVIIVYSLRVEIVNMFINKEDIVQKILPCIPFLCIYQMLEINNRNLYNWFRAIGRKLMSIIIPLCTYFVVMIAISLILTKVFNMGVKGIWISYIFAEAFSVITLLILYFFVINAEDSCKQLIEDFKNDQVRRDMEKDRIRREQEAEEKLHNNELPQEAKKLD